MEILVVEDPNIAEPIRDALEVYEHRVVTAPTIQTGIAHLARQHFDLVITGGRVAGKPGKYVLNASRKADHKTAVVVVGTRDPVTSRALQNMGANLVFEQRLSPRGSGEAPRGSDPEPFPAEVVPPPHGGFFICA